MPGPGAGLPLSVTLTGVYGRVELASPSTMSCKCNFACTRQGLIYRLEISGRMTSCCKFTFRPNLEFFLKF